MATTQDPLAPSTKEKIGSAVDAAKDRLSDAATQLRSTATQYGNSAADQVDKNAHTAANALQSAAEKLRSQGQTGGDTTVAGIAKTAAGKIDATADYLKDFDTRALLGQVENWTRNNPGVAIASAAALGFVIGLTLKRDSSRY